MIDWSSHEDNWLDVKRVARNTVGKDGSGTYPTNSWKKAILLAEHSPIRKLRYSWRWNALKYWVSVHFVRHKVGIEHWVSTQRSDRTGIDRDTKQQGSFVNHSCEANAQSLINISRKRLCNQASLETRVAWIEVKRAVEELDPVMSSVMVPECVYRGFCPEMNPCGYSETEAYKKALDEYRSKKVD